MLQRRSSLIAMSALIVALAGATARGRAADAPQPQQQPPPPMSLERLVEMRHHYIQVSLVHEAVIRGDLPAARTAAREMTRTPNPPGTLSQSVPFVLAINAAARRVVAAATLTAAASATVAMLQQCAECHQAVGVHPAPSAPRQPNVGGLVGHMLEHQRAADLLLQGLIVPSASQWTQGAEALRAAPLRSGDLPPDRRLNANLKLADDRVHQLAARADKASDPTTRGAVYTDLLTTCAQCHSLHGKVWGPARNN